MGHNRSMLLLYCLLLLHCTTGFLRLPGGASGLFPLLPLHSSESELPPNKDYKSPLADDSGANFIDSLKKSIKNFREEATAGSEVNVPTTNDSTELPLSFEDAVSTAAKVCVQGIRRGGLTKMRIDFDTSVGDMTYPSLKNTLPMAKLLFRDLGT